MRTKRAAIRRVLGELGSLEGVGRTAVGAAAFGLFAFRIGHERKRVECRRLLQRPRILSEGVGVKAGAKTRQASSSQRVADPDFRGKTRPRARRPERAGTTQRSRD